MGISRRNVLVGLGALVAGGGAVLGTGAFTTVQAQRTVSVETAGDADAFLALTAANTQYVQETDGTIEINLDGSNNANADGLNQNARTRFEDLVNVTNNGTQAVTSLTFAFDVTGTSDDAGHEAALSITSGSATIAADGNTNLLVESDAGDVSDDELGTGETVPFGIEVDLLDSGISDISTDAEITLTVSAETA